MGRGGTKYTLYIGGDSYGRRLNAEVQDSVPIEQIVPKLARIFTAFKANGELFGDYCSRIGLIKLKELVGWKLIRSTPENLCQRIARSI